MKVRIARKEYECSFGNCCVDSKKIKKGKVYVGFYFKDKDRFKLLRYHPECYEQFVLDKVQEMKDAVKEAERKIELRNAPKKSRGRPRKYSDPYRAIILKDKIRYYKKKGYEDKIAEVEAQLEELRLDK